MELALTALAGIGILLFLYSYLTLIIAGFKHHPVTGLISALPVLNIVTLPSLWHTTGRKLIIGFMGLILAAGAWFMGADKGFNNTLAMIQGRITGSPQTTSFSLTKTNPVLTTGTPAYDESKMIGLPVQALYKIGFEVIPLDKINSSLKGRIVKIITTKNAVLEGRVTHITASSLLIQSSKHLTENELPIANIKQLSLMVKKSK